MKKGLFFLLSLFFLFSNADESNAITVIRDSEIELVIKDLAQPVFRVAGLDATSIKIYIIQSDELNAFVMGGQNIFLTTGMISYSEDPDVLVGVIAHEVGHIVGGHLVARAEEERNMQKKMLLATVLGAAAGAATQSTDVGIGTITGAQGSLLASGLKFSRTQESAADSAGAKYLSKLGVKTDGLASFLGHLHQNERTFYGKRDDYFSTHPLSSDRIDFLRNYSKDHPVKKGSFIGDFARDRYARIVAKIYAYTNPADAVFQKYPGEDTKSRYAQVIAYMKAGSLNKASEILQKLIQKEPLNSYYFELLGQVYAERGQHQEALKYYQKAYSFLQGESLLRLEYAAQLITTKTSIPRAINLLEQNILDDNDDLNSWQQLSIAYGLNGDKANSNIALSWVSLLKGDLTNAKRMAALAEKEIDNKGKLKAKLDDLKNAIKNVENEATE